MLRKALRITVLTIIFSGSAATMSFCVAYYVAQTIPEHTESANIVLVGKLVEIIHGPSTGAPDLPAMGYDDSGLLPSPQIPAATERVVFLRIEVEETLKYHSYGLDGILAAYTTHAIDRPVGDHWFFERDQVGQRFLFFLGLAPIGGTKQGYHRFFMLNHASQVVDGKVDVLVERSPWTFRKIPLAEALATVKKSVTP